MVVASGQGQPPAAARPQMAEEVFTNVRVLRGIPVDEFMDTMGMFAASTGLNCTDCHVEESGGSWARYADDNQLKQTTRGMIAMVNTLNKSFFGGRPVMSCYSCHNGGRQPKVVPSLAVQYAVDPIIDDPFEIVQTPPGAPSVDEVFNQYLEAVGGAARLATLTSVVAEGKYRGFDDDESYPLEIFARAPNQRTTILHSQYGDMTTAFDGRFGWTSAPVEFKPQPVMALTGSNLEGLDLEAQLTFPGQIRTIATNWIVGPLSLVGDRDLRIVQGKKAGGLPIKLYFDEESGLLVKVVRYSDSPVGRVPTEIDYEEYEEVSGMRFPVKWTATWTDGRTVFELDSVRVNVAIDPARFARPTPPPR
jgi:outer membrane lipoprotein-sorting protein